MKFQVGDIIVRNSNNPDINYDFGGNHQGITVEGEEFVISASAPQGQFHNNELYSVEGSSHEDTPNWYYMEDNFDLYNPNQTSEEAFLDLVNTLQ